MKDLYTIVSNKEAQIEETNGVIVVDIIAPCR